MSFRRGPLVVIVVLLSIGLWSWDNSRRNPMIESTFPDGYTASVGPGAGGQHCGPVRVKAYVLLDITALVQRVYPGAAPWAATGSGFLMHTGWKVRAIRHAGSMYPKILIRIENGPYAGLTCWLPSGVRDAFENIQPGGAGG
jgi:hypothetical protein